MVGGHFAANIKLYKFDFQGTVDYFWETWGQTGTQSETLLTLPNDRQSQIYEEGQLE
jgi:hypothetical protein